MPQFDMFTFFVQVFWLTAALAVFFFNFLKSVLPVMFFGLKFRIKLLVTFSKLLAKKLKATLLSNKYLIILN